MNKNNDIIYGLEASSPIFLNNIDDVYIIDMGRVDIFSTLLIDNKPFGMRNHLFRCEKGDVIFGLDLQKKHNQIGLIGVGTPETMILKRDLNHLKELAANPAIAENIALMLENWLNGLSKGIKNDILPDKYYNILPDEEMFLKKGTIAKTDKGLLWIKNIKGSLSFIGRKKIKIHKEFFFPLSSNTWIYASEDSILYALKTEIFLNQNSLWSSLKQYYIFVLNCIYKYTIEKEENEIKQFKKRINSLQDKTQNALSDFINIYSSKKNPEVSKKNLKNHLFSACRFIENQMNIKFIFPKYNIKNTNKLIETIAYNSGLRARIVNLKQDWWKNDHGPLIGFIKDSKIPIALLPNSSHSYKLFDPLQKKIIFVNKKNSRKIFQLAYTFNRLFEDKSLNWFDLVKFSLFNTKDDIFAIIITGIIGAILALITPLLTSIIVDSIIPEASMDQLIQVSFILIACAISVSLFKITRYIAMLRFESKASTALQAAIWDRLLALPIGFFKQFTAGDLADRSIGIEKIRKLLSGAIVQSIIGGLFSCFNILLLYYFNKSLANIAILLIFFMVFINLLIGSLLLRYQRIGDKIRGMLTGTLFQFISNIAKLKVSGSYDRAFAIWAKEYAQITKINYKAGTVKNFHESFNAFFSVFIVCIIFMFVADNSSNYMTAGNFIAFYAALSSFQNSFLQMSNALTTFLQIIPIYERSKIIIQTLPELKKIHIQDFFKLKGHIEVSHIKFRYDLDGPLLLDDISFQAKPGEFIAIVGPSGSGKSTLLRLIIGFEYPESGTIFFDSTDLYSMNISEVRKQIGVVLQNSKVMTGDIFSNIVGMSNLNINDAWDAAKIASLDEDIKQMPMEMHTVINEGGTTLSGGQRQRLMIARAVVNKPKILLFDEATSALDNKTQEIATKNIEKLQATRIVIAHRLSTIANADKILVMDKGKIVQNGTYKELISQDGLFQKLAKRQII